MLCFIHLLRSQQFFLKQKVLRKHLEQYLKFDREEVLISEVLLSLFVYLSQKRNLFMKTHKH